MPAHMGLTGRINVLMGMAYANLSQSEAARAFRNTNKTVRKIQEKTGQEVTAPNTTRYMSYSAMDKDLRIHLKTKRESKFVDYDGLRRHLNFYDPDRRVPQGELPFIVPRSEWDLYLKPGTVFDEFLRQYSMEQKKEGFYFLVIRHRDGQRLKRLEAVMPSGRVNILCTVPH